MIKFIMVVYLILPTGETSKHLMADVEFSSKADCQQVGRAVQYVRPEVLGFTCLPYTEV